LHRLYILSTFLDPRFKDRFCDDKDICRAKFTSWAKELSSTSEIQLFDDSVNNDAQIELFNDGEENEPPTKKAFTFFDAISQTCNSQTMSVIGNFLHV